MDLSNQKEEKSGLSFEALGAKIDSYLDVGAAALGALLLTIGGAFAGNYNLDPNLKDVSGFWTLVKFVFTCPYVAMVIGFGATFLGGRSIVKKNEALERKNKQLEYENSKSLVLQRSLEAALEDCQTLKADMLMLHKKLVGTWLKGACKQVSLGSDARVTVYYERSEQFYLLARYSANPKFSKTNKQKFSLNSGVISLAWQHGEHVDEDCPSFCDDEQAYLGYLVGRYNFTAETAASFTMKSCRYLALAITDADENVGVILFESENPNGFDGRKDAIKRYCEEYQSHLCTFVRDALLYDKSVGRQRPSDGDEAVLAKLGGAHE
ncbi:hypothetical protein [Stutzerimonas stutzeri]|uniref:hypothetical protein n=1 Tax=Stutzerimonas stutzeri TaxID=316 RepID=UPI000B221260|nr:hypothetical protein [Stutzerimonas stutzeri]